MRRLPVLLAGILVASGAMAGSKPLQVSITPDIAVFNRSEKIEGLNGSPGCPTSRRPE